MIDKTKGILVTGANGLLGSHILKELLHQGFSNISALVREGADLQLIEGIKDKVNFTIGTLDDIFQLESAMKSNSMVIHSAGMVSYDPKKADKIYKVNEEGTANVVNTALTLNIDKLVHISSIAALGRDKIKSIIDEKALWTNSPHNTVYAKSKYLAEQQAWRAYYEGLPVTILNPSIILGIGNWTLTSLKFLPRIANGNAFYPKGSTAYVDVRDVARLAVDALDHKYDGERFIVSAENLSYKDFFDKLASKLNTKGPTISVGPLLAAIGWRIDWLKNLLFNKEPILTKETAASSALNVAYDNKKSKSAFNFNYRNIDQTINEMVDAYIKTNIKKD